jgi:SAM-dependent methyltransferase
VDDYARHRPGYPAGLIAVLRDALGLAPRHTVADVGSGTGKLAELFLDHGTEVVGVEPNAEMRAAGDRQLAARAGFRSVEGRAEATGLDDASVDLVVAGQAFHWFDPTAARAEFLRISRRPARAALVWNDRRHDATPFMADYEALVAQHGTDYGAVRHDHVDPDTIRGFFAGAAGACCWRLDELPLRQPLDERGFLGRLFSSSYLPAADDPGGEPLRRAAVELFRRHRRDGVVVVEYTTRIYSGRLERRVERPVGPRGG